MLKRDFGILLLSLFVIFYSLQQESTFSFHKAWFHSLGTDSATFAEVAVLPPPVVADLNGDGSYEVVVATHDCKLQVVKPAVPPRTHGFVAAKVMAEVSLLPQRVRICTGRRAVALAAGWLEEAPRELVRSMPKQVIVVVTTGWHVLCFDHNLQLLWSSTLQESMPQHTALHEVAIHISPHTVQKGDRGVVVVAASALRADMASLESDMAASFDGDLFEEELLAERDMQKFAHAGDADSSDKLDSGVDTSRFVSYVAFDGGSGERRWSQRSERADASHVAALHDSLIPQHNYRLAAAATSERSFNEASCRDFRESVLQVLPHRWVTRDDTRLHAAHFAKHHEGAQPRKHALAQPGKARQQQQARGDGTLLPIANVLNKAVGRGGAAGRAARQDGGGARDKPDNVLVAHLQEGIEVLHIATGKPVCLLHLDGGALHVDINGDGVLDHIHVRGGSDNGGTAQHTDLGHHQLPHCWAYALSGIPPSQPLFNGSICRHAAFGNMNGFGSRTFGRHFDNSQLEFAPPEMLPTPGRHGHYRAHAAQHGIALFLNSRGEATAYDAHGDKLWQVQTPAHWQNHLVDSAGFRVQPTLRALALHRDALPTAVLAAGAHSAVVLSEHGQTLFQFDLPQPPVQPAVVADFSGDGWNDILFVSRLGLFGYVQRKHAGGVPFTALMVCLMVVMLLVYFTQVGVGSGKKVSKRSTDRVD